MLLVFHKPYGVLSQFTPEPGSRWRTLAEFGFAKNIYSLGRLDADSEGLLLLSDEPALNSRLLDPKRSHSREYWVQVERIPTAAALGRLTRGGLDIEGHASLPCALDFSMPLQTFLPALHRFVSAGTSPIAGSHSNSPKAKTARSAG